MALKMLTKQYDRWMPLIHIVSLLIHRRFICAPYCRDGYL